MTYIDSETRIPDGQAGHQLMRQELYDRSMLDVEHCGQLCVLWPKRERLRRWFLNVEDRQQRLTLGSLGRVHRAEVHYRVGIGCYEGMMA